jgi:hypothetical protein
MAPASAGEPVQGIPASGVHPHGEHYAGEQRLGAARYLLAQAAEEEGTLRSAILRWSRDWQAQRILCVPYGAAELEASVLLKQEMKARLCLYIMDDHNIVFPQIADGVMERAVRAADLRLVISAEMKRAYEEKWGVVFHIFPPLVRSELLLQTWNPPGGRDGFRGILIGNIWSQHWLNQLRKTIAGSGCRVDWYTNNLQAPWLQLQEEVLGQEGIQISRRCQRKN